MKKTITMAVAGLIAAIFAFPALAASPGSGEPPGIDLSQQSAKANLIDTAGIFNINDTNCVAPAALASVLGTKGDGPQSSVLTAKAPSTILGTGSSMVLADKLPTPYPAIASTQQSIGVGGVMASVIGGGTLAMIGAGSGDSKLGSAWAQARSSAGGATWNSDLMAKGDYIGFDIGGGVRRNSTAIMTAQAPQKPAGNCGSCHSKKPATGGFASVSPPSGLMLLAA